MSAWQELNDYIYDVGATSQNLRVDDVCEYYFAKLFIIGRETHVKGVSISDDYWTVYDYDVALNTLTKHLDGDDLIATLEDKEYGPGGNYSFVLDANPDFQFFWVGTNGSNPVVVVSMQVDYGSLNYLTTVVVDADTNTITYESFDDNDVFYTSSASGSAVISPYYKAYTFQDRTFLVPSYSKYNYPDWILYENSGLKVYTPRILGSATYFYKVFHDHPTFISVVGSNGIVDYGDDMPICSGYSSGSQIYMTEEHLLAGSDFLHDVKYKGGSVLYTRQVLDMYFTYNELHQVTGATEYQQRILESIGGEVIYTEDQQSGNPFSNVYGPLTCQNEFYWNDIFYRNVTSDNDKLFFMPVNERIDDDKWTSQGDPNNYCNNTAWNEYKIFDTYENYKPSHTYITNMFTTLSTVKSDKSGSSRTHTLYGPVGPDTGIDVQIRDLRVDKTFLTSTYIYIWDWSYANLMYTTWESELSGEPTSITTLDDRIFIGGKSSTPAIFINGEYLTSGIAPGVAAISGFINTGMVFVDSLPTMATSGLYVAVPMVRVFSISGEAYVRLYGSDALAHGNILPHRALLINYGIWDDISGTLPSGFTGRSIEMEADLYICGTNGAIYHTADLSTWSLFDTIDPIQATCLAYTNEFFVATPAGESSIIRTTSLTNPNFISSDSGLPDGVTVLDIEEETYADR